MVKIGLRRRPRPGGGTKKAPELGAFLIILFRVQIRNKLWLPMDNNLPVKHHLFCIEHNLLGRIIVAAEGLNGTVSGLKEDCDAYMQWLENDPIFAGTDFDFKIESSDVHTFNKLHVPLPRSVRGRRSSRPLTPR